MTVAGTLFVLLEILRTLAWPGQHEQPGQSAYRTPDEFKAAWVADGGAPADLPKVDFDREMVLAVFSGQKNTGGHAVKIEQVIDNGSAVVAIFRMTSPGPDDMVTQALTYPSSVVVVPKRESPVTFIAADSPAAAELLLKAQPQK